MAKVATRAQSN